VDYGRRAIRGETGLIGLDAQVRDMDKERNKPAAFDGEGRFSVRWIHHHEFRRNA
jgi:hypothetical protein